MAIEYQNGLTVNTNTGQILGVGNLTGTGGQEQNTGVPGWTPTGAVTAAPSGQLISATDPNASAYYRAAQQTSTAPQTASIGMLSAAAQTNAPLRANIEQFDAQQIAPSVAAFKVPEVADSLKATDLTKSTGTDVQKALADNQAITGDARRAGLKQSIENTLKTTPNAVANEAFIQAVAQANLGRPASADELKHVSQGGALGGSITDVMRRFGRGPQVPGGNPNVPETTQPADPEVAAVDGTVDPIKLMATLSKQMTEINNLIASEREAFDTSVASLGQELGTVAPLIQGEQVFQEQRKNARLQKLVDLKSSAIETGNLQLKVLDYADKLRKDQADGLSSVISTFLSNGVPISSAMAKQYANLLKIDPQSIEDGFAIAAKNYLAKQTAVAEQRDFENKLALSKTTAVTPKKSTATGTTRTGVSGKGVSGVATPGTEKLSSFAQDIYENPALMNNLTPTEKGKIMKEISNAGLNLKEFGTEKLSVASRENIAQFDDLIRQSDEAFSILESGLDVGPVASRISAGQAALGFAPEFTNYRSVVDNMGSALLRLRSGAAVTPDEYNRVKGFIPNINDDESTARIKINKFNKEMKTVQSGFVNRMTQTTKEIINTVNNQESNADALINKYSK